MNFLQLLLETWYFQDSSLNSDCKNKSYLVKVIGFKSLRYVIEL